LCKNGPVKGPLQCAQTKHSLWKNFSIALRHCPCTGLLQVSHIGRPVTASIKGFELKGTAGGPIFGAKLSLELGLGLSCIASLEGVLK